MRIRDLPIEQFYRIAAKALFGTQRDKRWTKQVALRRGDSCQGIVHDLWLRLADTETNDLRPSTFIYYAATWERYRNNDKRRPLNHETLVDDRATDESVVRDDVELRLLRATLLKVVRTLTNRERIVIEMRYGLGDGYCYTLLQVGRVLKITRSRAHQIEQKAFVKLRAGRRRDKLAGLVLN